MSFAHWKKLLYGIEKGECILFLGPELPVATEDGEAFVASSVLANRLAESLDDCEQSNPNTVAGNLAWLAQRFVGSEDEVGLEMEIAEWHKQLRSQNSSLHDDLAALPFRLIITSSHDPLMQSALERAGKTPVIERYHFRGRNKDLLPEPTVESPVVFHLYGHVSEPTSVVITETQLLDFLAKLIASDPPLPNDVNAMLSNGRQFLFLGFGLRQWYLRILLHVLKVLRSGSRTFAIERIEEGGRATFESAILFYRQNFKMDVHPTDVREFVHELRNQYETEVGATTQSLVRSVGGARIEPAAVETGTTVFICHASEDAERARQIHAELKRAGLDPWLDKDALRGGDNWDDHIESTIRKVDYFVVLNSRALDVKSRGASYVNKEIKKAIEAADLRLLGSFIIPVLIDDTPLLEPLAKYHAVNLESEGVRAVVRAIKRQVGATGFSPEAVR